MESIYLNIAGIPIRLRTAFPLDVTERYAPFLVQKFTAPGETLEFYSSESFPQMPQPAVWHHGGVGFTCLGGREVVLRRLGAGAPPYLMEEVLEPMHRRYQYLRSSNETPVNLIQVFNNISFETLLKRHGAMMLHCSLVRWNGQAILFSAPSGTGKSTQADLWETYMGSETLDGDRAGLRSVDGVWRAYGLPFAGSSGIYRNDSAPIRAVVMLSQGPDNRIERLSPARCLHRILPEVTLHRWDPEFMNWGLDRLTDLLTAVPCYHLSCRPDRGAVELLHNTLTQEV